VSAYSQEKFDLLSGLEGSYARELDQEPVIAKFVKKMLTYELYPMDEREIEQQLAAFEPFQDSTKNSKLHRNEFIK